MATIVRLTTTGDRLVSDLIGACRKVAEKVTGLAADSGRVEVASVKHRGIAESEGSE